MPLLEVQSISKSYDQGGQTLNVLSDISFSVAQGEALAIVGASGSGKSTLLHILGTLDQADEGEVFFDGESLSAWDEAAIADFRNRSLGFVFQFHHLLTDFDAVENVMIPALIAGESKSRARTLAMDALALVGLSHRVTHRPNELSGGEQQRVALARAIVMKPRLLLADEVTGNLDKETGTEIHQLLARMNSELGITTVLVTHNQMWAETLSRRLVLDSGHVMERS